MGEEEFSTLPGAEQGKPSLKPVEQPALAVGPAALRPAPPTQEIPKKGGMSRLMIALIVVLLLGLVIIGGLSAAVYFGYLKLPAISLPGFDLSGIFGTNATKSVVDDKARENALDAISNARTAIRNAENSGADISTAKTLLSSAEKAADNGDYPTAISDANEAANKAKAAEAKAIENKKKKDAENEMPPPLPDEV